jgi:hypothetical protein
MLAMLAQFFAPSANLLPAQRVAFGYFCLAVVTLCDNRADVALE